MTDTHDATIPAIRHHVTVPVPPGRAFDLFTGRMGDWWPREHQIGTSPKAGIAVEPRLGGEVRELGEDGSECLTGRILVWEPPSRVVISWQITARWAPEPDPSRASDYEVVFTDLGDGTTRVDVEHRHLERHGPEDGRSIAAAVDAEQGWLRVLAGFRAFAAA